MTGYDFMVTPPKTPAPGLKYYYPLRDAPAPRVVDADVVIYGGTSAGVAAAIQAHRMGKRAVLLVFGRHVGGLTTSGLGATDIGNKDAIGGISREFYRRLGEHYGQEEMWTFEPSVAERLFHQMLDEAQVEVFFEHRLQLVRMDGNRITLLATDNGSTFRAPVFIDASYEGDLMAQAGVRYHVGRESNDTYGETLNGIQFGSPNHRFRVPVDPYRAEGDPASGLLPGVQDLPPGKNGQGDRCVQAYNFRLCMSSVKENQKPFPKPDGYDPLRYELLLRYLRGGVWDVLRLTRAMPNGKTDTNNYGGFSSDNIGMNYDWAEGDYATRERIFQDHVTYHQGMMWFLANDDRVPEEIQSEVRGWGLPLDEFAETGGWPHELYVREARRMVGDVVMTEHHCRHAVVVDDPVGMAAYTMDSHNCRRLAIDGIAVNEGNVEVPPSAPYPISYRAIVPRQQECANLLVPWCLSASHIAFGSIRMEPVGMILGQSAATAACLAIEAGCAVQEIEYRHLRDRLTEDAQVLEHGVAV